MAISTATVKAYCDTGFNTVNIPDSPATLQNAASSVVTLDTINCLPLSGLTTSITVKSFANLPKADYISIAFAQDSTTYYGAIVGYEYISLDTVRIDIVLDGWLTCKAKGIQSVSGVTKRVHVPKSADTFGAFTEDDPMLVCAEPLEVKTASWKMTGDRTIVGELEDDPVVIIASTIDLYALGDEDYDEAWQYVAKNQGGEESSVTVPKVPAVQDYIMIKDSSGVVKTTIDTLNCKQHATMAFQTPGGGAVSRSDITIPCVNYFDGSDPQVIKGIAVARGLGIENGIIAQYTVPKKFISGGTGNPKKYGRYTLNGATDFFINGVSDMNNTYGDSQTHEFYLDYSADVSGGVQNKRLLCGDVNKFGLISPASGNSFEARPEDLKVYDDAAGVEQPAVLMTADPREGGKPYYKFQKINGDEDIFCRGLVPGENWQNAPITQYQNSGYVKEMTKMKNNYNLAVEGAINKFEQNAISALAGMFGGGVSGNDVSNAFAKNGVDNSGAESYRGPLYTTGTNAQSRSANFGINMIGSAANLIGSAANTHLAIKQMEKQRLVEMEAFMLDNYTVAPEIMFPRVPGLVDFVGNGVVIYRYRPTDKDLVRLDKVLNAFGYAHTKMLELSDFSNRSRYNYIMASGVKINCNGVAKFVREAAEDQIALGVRIWHRKPDNDYAAANN